MYPVILCLTYHKMMLTIEARTDRTIPEFSGLIFISIIENLVLHKLMVMNQPYG